MEKVSITVGRLLIYKVLDIKVFCRFSAHRTDTPKEVFQLDLLSAKDTKW